MRNFNSNNAIGVLAHRGQIQSIAMTKTSGYPALETATLVWNLCLTFAHDHISTIPACKPVYVNWV